MRIRKDGPIGNVVEKIKTKVRDLITELRSEGGNKKIIRVLSYVLMAVGGALIIKGRVEFNSRMKDLKKAKDSVNQMADEMGLEGEARGVITSRVEESALSAEEIAHRKFVLHGLAGLIGLLMSLISRTYASAAREDSMRKVKDDDGLVPIIAAVAPFLLFGVTRVISKVITDYKNKISDRKLIERIRNENLSEKDVVQDLARKITSSMSIVIDNKNPETMKYVQNGINKALRAKTFDELGKVISAPEINRVKQVYLRAKQEAERVDSKHDSLKRYIDRAIEREVRRYLRDYGVKGMKKGQRENKLGIRKR